MFQRSLLNYYLYTIMERSSGRARKASQKVVESREVFLPVEEVVSNKRKVKTTNKEHVNNRNDSNIQKGNSDPIQKQPRIVYQIPEPISQPIDQFIPSSVALSLLDKAAQITVSPDQMTCTGVDGGFRMIRATHGVHFGPYYWECEILPPLSSSGVDGARVGALEPHVRVGWSTRFGELRGPVGYDKHSYGYRDVAGKR